MSLNSTFTLMHSKLEPALSPRQDFATLQEALLVYQGLEAKGNKYTSIGNLVERNEARVAPESFGKLSNLGSPNVVVIVVESLAAEYMGAFNPWPGFTPFLDSLAKKGFLSPQSFANGRRSIDAVWSVFAGIPSLMDEPFVTSPFRANRVESLPKSLAAQGYSSAFFHGGKNGTMYFDFFARMSAFQNFYGLNEFPAGLRENNFDGTWGIFDGPYLEYFGQMLSKQKEPFFSALFTLSSHNPYTLPAAVRAKFAAVGEHKMHGAIAYTDYALQQFFEQISSFPWFNNTIFVITGDHTSVNTQKPYANNMGEFRVPILFFAPRPDISAFLEQQSVAKRLVQHTDISCAIEGLLRRFAPIKQSNLAGGVVSFAVSSPFCMDPFSENSNNAALFESGGSYTIVSGDASLVRNKSQLVTPLDSADLGAKVSESGLVQDAGKRTELTKEQKEFLLERRLRAGVQLFNNGMLQNRLYSKPYTE